MRSKNSRAQTPAESVHMAKVKRCACVLCAQLRALDETLRRVAALEDA